MGIMDFSKQAIKNLLSKPATLSYPIEPRQYPERSRGHIEINIDECIMCGLCQRTCMSAAITVDRATKTWSIERMGCIQCGACVNACPKKCLNIIPGYTEPAAEKTVDSFSQPIPETPPGKIVNDMDKCILCGLCARKCPQECITVDRTGAKTWSIDRDKCVQCGACIDACAKFKALSTADDDGEKGVVTFAKEAKPATEEKAEAPQAGKIVNDIEKCILCGLCSRKCPQEAIVVDRTGEKTWSIDRDKCIQCGACIDACLKFKALSTADDDGEKGIVTIHKE